MPTPALKSFAQQSGKSVGEVERLWKKAKAVAQDMGKGDNYAYITGVLKSMLDLDEQRVYTLLGQAYAEATSTDTISGDLEFVQDYEQQLAQQIENEGPMVSTSFPVLPEVPPRKKSVQ